jgi:hypothetical protein
MGMEWCDGADGQYKPGLPISHHKRCVAGGAGLSRGVLPGEIASSCGVSLHPPSQGEADRDACVRYALHIGNLFSEPLFHGCYPQPLFDWLVRCPQVQPGDWS